MKKNFNRAKQANGRSVKVVDCRVKRCVEKTGGESLCELLGAGVARINRRGKNKNREEKKREREFRVRRQKGCLSLRNKNCVRPQAKWQRQVSLPLSPTSLYSSVSREKLFSFVPSPCLFYRTYILKCACVRNYFAGVKIAAQSTSTSGMGLRRVKTVNVSFKLHGCATFTTRIPLG